MIVAGRRRLEQPPLFVDAFDSPIANGATARNVVGDYFEALTAAVCGGARLKTDSRADICPDVHVCGDVYAESKSVGRSGSAIVYAHRFENDREFETSNGARLFYFFWRHRCEATAYPTTSALRAALAAAVDLVVVASMPALHEVLRDREVRVLNSGKLTPAGARLGYGSNGYGRGWSFPLSAIVRSAHEVGSVRGVPVYFAGVEAAREFRGLFFPPGRAEVA